MINARVPLQTPVVGYPFFFFFTETVRKKEWITQLSGTGSEYKNIFQSLENTNRLDDILSFVIYALFIAVHGLNFFSFISPVFAGNTQCATDYRSCSTTTSDV